MSFGLGQGASVFHFNLGNGAVCQVNAHSTHTLCKTKVRLNNLGNAFGNGRHVNRGHNRAAFQGINNAISNIHSYTDLSFFCGCAQVRSLYYIEEAQEGIVFFGQGLGGINVDGSASNFARFEAFCNSVYIKAFKSSKGRRYSVRQGTEITQLIIRGRISNVPIFPI